MNGLRNIKSPFLQRILVILSIMFSASCWYYSNGLSGDFPYLLWIAPIPVLVISLKINAKQTFLVSFFAYLIGRLSWFIYLAMVATLIPALLFTLVFALIFALIIAVTRKTIIKTDSWFSVFAFPVFFTTFEFLLIHFSPDGTAASIAYSQANLLPVIQIASISGILGITFMVTLIPSAIVLGWHFRYQEKKTRNIVISSMVLLIPVLLFGFIRLSNNSDKKIIEAGLVVLDEKSHNVSDHPDFQKEKLQAADYMTQVSILAGQGAQIVVLPERAVNINKETEGEMINIFINAAIKNKVYLIIGYTNYRNEKEFNSALVIDEFGNIISDYNKVHLVTGLENRFTRGSEAGLFNFHSYQAGISICKDLDFPAFIRDYGKMGAGILLVPAWDFVVDDWLHSRMAILRGVEFGFSEIRTAREGRLTISDMYGRVKFEASCSNGQKTTLAGNISCQNVDTIYTRSGDWFGIMNLIVAMLFIFAAIRRTRYRYI
jgi:apolipoprotein N-acyltransferase